MRLSLQLPSSNPANKSENEDSKQSDSAQLDPRAARQTLSGSILGLIVDDKVQTGEYTCPALLCNGFNLKDPRSLVAITAAGSHTVDRTIVNDNVVALTCGEVFRRPAAVTWC